jgi:hypothetical protein
MHLQLSIPRSVSTRSPKVPEIANSSANIDSPGIFYGGNMLESQGKNAA